jgi:hypothetical protein
MINPELERFMSTRAKSETIELKGSHAIFLSPEKRTLSDARSCTLTPRSRAVHVGYPARSAETDRVYIQYLHSLASASPIIFAAIPRDPRYLGAIECCLQYWCSRM